MQRKISTFPAPLGSVVAPSASVASKWAGGEVLPDQAGAGAVLSFSFSDEVDLIWVLCVRQGANERMTAMQGAIDRIEAAHTARDAHIDELTGAVRELLERLPPR